MILTRSFVKAHIEDADRVFIADAHTYVPHTGDHCRLWPLLVAAIGNKGAWYSTLKAICGPNKDYIAYLIAEGALKCPALNARKGDS